MTARRQPQAHSACPTGGERVDTARCVDCRSVAIDSFVDRQGTGILPLVAGGGEAKEDPGTRSRLCCYRSCPRVCSISRTGSNSTVAIGSGSESPPKFDEQLVSIKRRVAVKNCLGRYPVVARRCLASYTPRLAELCRSKVATWDRTLAWVRVRQPHRHLGCSHPSGAAAQLRCGAGIS